MKNLTKCFKVRNELVWDSMENVSSLVGIQFIRVIWSSNNLPKWSTALLRISHTPWKDKKSFPAAPGGNFFFIRQCGNKSINLIGLTDNYLQNDLVCRALSIKFEDQFSPSSVAGDRVLYWREWIVFSK